MGIRFSGKFSMISWLSLSSCFGSLESLFCSRDWCLRTVTVPFSSSRSGHYCYSGVDGCSVASLWDRAGSSSTIVLHIRGRVLDNGRRLDHSSMGYIGRVLVNLDSYSLSCPTIVVSPEVYSLADFKAWAVTNVLSWWCIKLKTACHNSILFLANVWSCDVGLPTVIRSGTLPYESLNADCIVVSSARDFMDCGNCSKFDECRWRLSQS